MTDGAGPPTLAVLLDGYTDLPPGMIANVVTYFEMTRPAGEAAVSLPAGLSIREMLHPDPVWYRDLYRRIGEQWLWFSRAVMPEEALAALLANPATEILALEDVGGTAVGLAELHRSRGEVEIAMFGVVPALSGTGAARCLMRAALDRAWGRGTGRVWLHTCSFDHPAVVGFYKRAGLTPYKFAIEISRDPRITGHLPETAGPHVALIKPRA